MTRGGEPTRFVVSCEHGGNEVPPRYEALFEGAADALRSHRGWDPGTLPLARRLAEALDAPLHASTTTRLLVDLNRSPGHPKVLSELTRVLPAEARRDLVEEHHAPYRRAVAGTVERALARGGVVVHLSVHSFTPVLDGQTRATDLALLYDPARAHEAGLCRAWVRALRDRLPERTIRSNHPYRGVADGLTTWLRRRTATPRYVGVEIEVCQRWLDDLRFPDWVGDALLASLAEARSRVS